MVWNAYKSATSIAKGVRLGYKIITKGIFRVDTRIYDTVRWRELRLKIVTTITPGRRVKPGESLSKRPIGLMNRAGGTQGGVGYNARNTCQLFRRRAVNLIQASQQG